MSPKDYHADVSRDSNSSLSLFHRSVPRYAAERIFKTHKPKEPTPEMLVGNAFDTLLLTPDEFDSLYTVAPECDRRTKIGKAIWEDFCIEANGKDILDLEQLALVRAMREAVLAELWARKILEAEGECQKVITWEHLSKRPLKMCADKIRWDGMIVDIKTASDISPSALARSAATYGYHRQAALYLAGAKTAGIGGPFVFLVVGKEAPHEVVIYTLDDASLDLGRQENERLIYELQGRYESGDWSSRWGGVQVVSLPKYAFYERAV